MAGFHEQAVVAADLEAQRLFHFGLVGRGGGDAGVLQQAIARIERHRHGIERAARADGGENLRRGGAVAVVGDEQRVGSAGILARAHDELADGVAVEGVGRLAIHAHHLLPAGMRHAR